MQQVKLARDDISANNFYLFMSKLFFCDYFQILKTRTKYISYIMNRILQLDMFYMLSLLVRLLMMSLLFCCSDYECCDVIAAASDASTPSARSGVAAAVVMLLMLICCASFRSSISFYCFAA